MVPPVQTSNSPTPHMFVQPLNETEYSILPVYVANQFSLDCINQHLNTINTFLWSNSDGEVLGIEYEPQFLSRFFFKLLILL